MNTKHLPYILIAVIAASGGFALSVFLTNRSIPVKADTLAQPHPATSLPQKQTASRALPAPRPDQIFELPEAEREKLTGRGDLDSENYFNCVLTNRSRWRVTDVRFHIASGNPEGSVSWERTYREPVDLRPGQAARISFKVIDSRDVASRWKITAARGYPPLE